MIAPLQSIPPTAPVNSAVRPVRAEATAFRPPVEQAQVVPGVVVGGRGAPVSGSTLIAAQEEASRLRKPAEEAAEKPAAQDGELTEEQEKEVRDLKARDLEVRAHEQAHARVGGRYASAPSYEFEQGPDGQSYAVGGHVSISTSPIAGDPQATIDKMDQVKRAALAPSEPSGQDRRVAADAQAKRAEAQAELSAISREEMQARFGETEETGQDEPLSDEAETQSSVPASRDAADAQDASRPSNEIPAPDDSGKGGLFGTGGFADALNRAVSTASAVVGGGLSRMEIQPGAAVDTALPTRRTGVDIRV